MFFRDDAEAAFAKRFVSLYCVIGGLGRDNHVAFQFPVSKKEQKVRLKGKYEKGFVHRKEKVGEAFLLLPAYERSGL
jgi:6-phosphogluconolactonase/glucosamine-6-phosphate isomerase/deaminase